MDNLEKLIQSSRIAYGDNWQSPVSRALGISDRTIRNFVSGKSPAPIDLSSRLRAAMESEIAKYQAAIDFIDSDRMSGDDISLEVIIEIVDKYKYIDGNFRSAAIDAVNNSVYEITWLSDLEQISKKFSNGGNDEHP